MGCEQSKPETVQPRQLSTGNPSGTAGSAVATKEVTTDYSSGSNNKDFTKKRLIAVYEKHNPDKVQNVDKLLTKYDGDECVMLQKLEKTYGDNPTELWLLAFYTKYNKDRVPTVKPMMEKYKGDEEAMFIKLTTKYNDPPLVGEPAETVAGETADTTKSSTLPADDTNGGVDPKTGGAKMGEPCKSEECDSAYECNKKRISDYYTKYNPEKIDTVDDVLKKYEGNEEELFRKLQSKYGEGPEGLKNSVTGEDVAADAAAATTVAAAATEKSRSAPSTEGESKAAPAAAAVAATAAVATGAAVAAAAVASKTEKEPNGPYASGCKNKDFNKKRLVATYEKHNPDKVAKVDTLLKKYEGDECAMLQKLEDMYGDNPTELWLVAFYTKYNKDRVSSAPDLLAKYKGNEEAMFTKLVNKYNDPVLVAEEPAGARSIEEPAVAAPAAESAPAAATAAVATGAAAAAVASKTEKEPSGPYASGCKNKDFNKKRLVATYEKHNPDKVAKVDTLLKKYEGDECAMLQKLEDTYGDNPTELWLVAFYTKYNKDRVSSAPTLLEKYKGNEEAMFTKLVKKYNDPVLVTEEPAGARSIEEPAAAAPAAESAPAVAAPAAAAATAAIATGAAAAAVASKTEKEPSGPYVSGCKNKDFNKKRLVATYEKHNPDKVAKVDNLLKKYEGDECAMLQKLEDTYGDNPTELWLVAFYTKYNKDRVSSAPTLLAKYKGNEEAMFTKLVNKYNDPVLVTEEPAGARSIEEPASAAATAAVATGAAAAAVAPKTEKEPSGPYASGCKNKDFNKKRLVATYERHNPNKVEKVDKLLAKYEGDECSMLEKLEETYGENPTELWLLAFYKKYNKDRVPTVKPMMEKYKGNEEAMFMKLTNKYNDPPLVEEAAAASTAAVASAAAVPAAQDESRDVAAADTGAAGAGAAVGAAAAVGAVAAVAAADDDAAVAEERALTDDGADAVVERGGLDDVEPLTLDTAAPAALASAAAPTTTDPPSPTSVASEYHLKLLELIDDVEQGKQELQIELAKEHGPGWAGDEEIAYKYSDMLKRMTKIKQREINSQLGPHEQIQHVIMIDEVKEGETINKGIIPEQKPKDDDGYSIYSGFGDGMKGPLGLLDSSPRSITPVDDWRKYYVR